MKNINFYLHFPTENWKFDLLKGLKRFTKDKNQPKEVIKAETRKFNNITRLTNDRLNKDRTSHSTIGQILDNYR